MGLSLLVVSLLYAQMASSTHHHAETFDHHCEHVAHLHQHDASKTDHEAPQDSPEHKACGICIFATSEDELNIDTSDQTVSEFASIQFEFSIGPPLNIDYAQGPRSPLSEQRTAMRSTATLCEDSPRAPPCSSVSL